MDDHWSDISFGIYYRIRNARKIERKKKLEDNAKKNIKSTTQRNSAKRAMFRKNPNCHWCGLKLDWSDCSLEHIIPLSEGGNDSPENLGLSCRRFNNERSNGRAKPCGQEDDEETKVMAPQPLLNDLDAEKAREMLAETNRKLKSLMEFAKQTTDLHKGRRGSYNYIRHVISVLSEQARTEEKRVEVDVKFLNWLPDHIPIG